MKFDQILESIQQAQIDEVRMGASDLDAFVNSPEAQGIKCGFEAELIFAGKAAGAGGPDYDSDPEPDYDPDTTADSIQEIADFFEDGEYNSRRDVRNMRESMESDYLEWFSEQFEEHWSEIERTAVEEYLEAHDWDLDDAIRDQLSEQGLDDDAIDAAMLAGARGESFTSSKQDREAREKNEAYARFAEARDAAIELLRERVDDEIDNRGSAWESAREQAEEEFRDNDEASERDWLRDQGIRHMSDVRDNYGDISWPYWTYPERDEGGYSEDAAYDLARSLENTMPAFKIGKEEYEPDARAGSGYHSVRRDYKRNPNLWIVEEDGSLHADDYADMPAEIVSPPIPLPDFDRVIDEFWSWAQSEDAYSNRSTGFHVGVSMPTGGEVDYMKLALFLGDRYVLEKFDRLGNTYTESAMKKITRDMKPSDYPNAVTLLRANLIELASKTLRGNRGHGKYTSINMKDDYVEFRSMGGADYFQMLPEIKNTVKRYAYAMYIASSPHLERKEYAKKLYKLVGTVTSENEDVVNMFVKYSTGVIDRDELFGTVRSKQLSRQFKRGKLSGPYWWKVNAKDSGLEMEVVANSPEEAIEKARNEAGSSWQRKSRDEFTATLIKPYAPEFPVWYVSPTGQPGSEIQVRARDMRDARQEARQKRPDIFGDLADHEIRADKTSARESGAVPGSTQDLQQRRAGGEFTGSWKIVDSQGREVHRFGGVGNVQADANRVARAWVHANVSDNNGPYDVLPIMA